MNNLEQRLDFRLEELKVGESAFGLIYREELRKKHEKKVKGSEVEGEKVEIKVARIRVKEGEDDYPYMSEFVDRMLKEWKMSDDIGMPSVILSIAGGAGNFKMAEEDWMEFKHSFRELVATDRLWMTSGGTRCGIMERSGKLQRDEMLCQVAEEKDKSEVQNVLIGIAPWGFISGRRDSTTDIALDFNHTHFIFVDDGLNGLYSENTEQPFRAKFEKTLAEQLYPSQLSNTRNGTSNCSSSSTSSDGKSSGRTSSKVYPEHDENSSDTVNNERSTEIHTQQGESNSSDTVNNERSTEIHTQQGESGKAHVICMLVEGGLAALLTMESALKNGIPCIVIKGSGRMADIVAKLKTSEGGEAGEAELESVSNLLKTSGASEEQIQTAKKSLKKVAEHVRAHKEHVRVLDVTGGLRYQLDLELMRTIVQNTKMSNDCTELLRLALDWDVPEVVADIQRETKKDNPVFPEKEEYNLNKTVYGRAFLEDKTEFIKLFWGKLVEKRQINRDSLEKLYSKTDNLYSLEKSPWLLGENFHPEEGKVIKTIEKKLKGRGFEYHHVMILSVENKKYTNVFKCPERELFLYCILFLKEKTSLFFWEKLPGKLAAALMAYHMLVNFLDEKSIISNDVIFSKIKKMRDNFERRALGLVDTCFNKDVKITMKVLQVKHEYADASEENEKGKDCMTIADGGEFMEFFATAACQMLMMRRWCGEIKDTTSLKIIIIASLFPPLIFFLKRRECKKDGNEQTRLTIPEFYQAPIIKYWLHNFSTLVYLTLFSIFVLRGLDSTIFRLEYVVMAWTVSLSLELVYKLYKALAKNRLPKNKDGFCMVVGQFWQFFTKNRWNLMEIFALLSFGAGWLLRDIRLEEQNMALGAYVFCLMCYFSKATKALTRHHYLGPKIVMITKMLNDLFGFFCILLAYLLAYGVAVQALMYPRVFDPIFSVMWGVLFRPFFEMLGDPILEDIGAVHYNNYGNCSDENEASWPYKVCPDITDQKTYYALILKAMFMVFTNVLLLNLLIALFNNRYVEVNEQSNIFWKYLLYKMTLEYELKPSLPQPLFLLWLIGRFCQWMFRSLSYGCISDYKGQAKEMEKAILKWEDLRAEEYLLHMKRDNESKVETKLEKQNSQIRLLEDQIKLQNVQIKALEEKQNDQIKKMAKKFIDALDDRSNKAYQELKEIKTLLHQKERPMTAWQMTTNAKHILSHKERPMTGSQLTANAKKN